MKEMIESNLKMMSLKTQGQMLVMLTYAKRP